MRRPRDTGRALSPENVEVVRRVYYTWNAGDMTALRDLCAPDVVMHHPEGWPEPGPSAGREAVCANGSRFATLGRATRWSS
jgi:ketosteroid isomerase-like protein